MALSKKSTASKSKSSFSDFSANAKRTKGSAAKSTGKGKGKVPAEKRVEPVILGGTKQHYDLQDDFQWSTKFARFYSRYVRKETWHNGDQFAHTEGLNDLDHLLRLWDDDAAYGPCIGLSRLERWERAQELGLEPPQEIRDIIKICEFVKEREIGKVSSSSAKEALAKEFDSEFTDCIFSHI